MEKKSGETSSTDEKILKNLAEIEAEKEKKLVNLRKNLRKLQNIFVPKTK